MFGIFFLVQRYGAAVMIHIGNLGFGDRIQKNTGTVPHKIVLRQAGSAAQGHGNGIELIQLLLIDVHPVVKRHDIAQIFVFVAVCGLIAVSPVDVGLDLLRCQHTKQRRVIGLHLHMVQPAVIIHLAQQLPVFVFIVHAVDDVAPADFKRQRVHSLPGRQIHGQPGKAPHGIPVAVR